ncbi:hypothetical protein ACFWY6_18950 [Streptomyces sp. NPDC059037]|uniref:hypothetical protein n=1 Tax=Streptomyces sp. NPDC059037 TaxID=3346710 RepID=UPI0036769DB9
MNTQASLTSSRVVEEVYGRYVQHLMGCPRCRRGAPCRKGTQKRIVWRAARHAMAGITPPAQPKGSRRSTGGL